MKANELMIGDWYAFRGHPYKCTASDIASIAECEENCVPTDISEIPLTPEILEKNGFKQQGTGWILEDSMGERIFNLCRISNAYCLLIAGMTLTFQYVHELQHLFRLAGIKGEIKL